jgi:effector-binding domain-containing protein
MGLTLLWYLLIKPQDYQVRFQAKALPGTIYETVKSWNNTLDSVLPMGYGDPTRFQQSLVAGDSVHRYHWVIDRLHDSLSQVKVNIKDPDHSLANKLSVLFSDTDFEKGARKKLLGFNSFLNDHLRDIKISFEGEAELFSTFCACVAITSAPEEKAKGMMANYSLLNSYLVGNGVTLNGHPFVEVESWDLKANSMDYNFCFPIIRSENLPRHPSITYKRIFAKNCLKAIYNGHYISSDRAWYALVDYAEQHDIPIERKPLEVFFNNPNLGGDGRDWRTEVYLPLKETK